MPRALCVRRCGRVSNNSISKTTPHKNVSALIFDLDGTLWDAVDSTVVGWNNVSDRLGLRDVPLRREDLEKVTGRPIGECISELFPGCSRDLDDLIAMLEREEQECISSLGGACYPELHTGIESLSEHYRLFIISNCQEWYLLQFLEMTGLSRFFAGWDCHGMSLVPKGDMIASMMQRYELKEVVYVGDTLGDLQAAESSGADFCFAAYGFGEVTRYDYVGTSFSDLCQFFLGEAPPS